MAALSLFSNETITEAELGPLMARLGATPGEHEGWKLERNGRHILIEIGDLDPRLFTEEELEIVSSLLGSWPQSRVVLIFDERTQDRFENRLAIAVSKAMAELWPIVSDDNTGQVEVVPPPGGRPRE